MSTSHRSKPFSTKQKKAQLAEKRARKKEQQQLMKDEEDDLGDVGDHDDVAAFNEGETVVKEELTETDQYGREEVRAADSLHKALNLQNAQKSHNQGHHHHHQHAQQRASTNNHQYSHARQPSKTSRHHKEEENAEVTLPPNQHATKKQQKHRNNSRVSSSVSAEYVSTTRDSLDSNESDGRDAIPGAAHSVAKSVVGRGGAGGSQQGIPNLTALEGQAQHKLMSVFAKLSPKEIEQRKHKSREPFTRLPQTALEIGLDDLYPNKTLIDFPKRPAWTSSDTKRSLEAREEASFQNWMAKLYSTWPAEELSYFEHNLEVWRQLWRVVEISDIVLFVVDARHPVLHFPPKLYEYVVEELGKKLVLVFNKIDLIDASTLLAWKSYFQTLHRSLPTSHFSIYPPELHLTSPTSTIRATLQASSKRRRRVGGRYARSVGVVNVLRACQGVDVDGVDWDGLVAVEEERLRVVEEEFRRWKEREEEGEDGGGGRGVDAFGVAIEDEKDDTEHGVGGKVDEDDASDEDDHDTSRADAILEALKDVVTIGLVGHPNVGKSSIINGLMGRKVVSTSSTPGHTKHFQTIHIAKHIRLCDCPGLVFPSVLPKPLQILSGMYKIAQVQEPYSAVQYLAERVPLESILRLKPPTMDDLKSYKWSAWDICEVFAIDRGFLTPRVGRPDVYRAANLILRMANDGRILLGFKPPGYFARLSEWMEKGHAHTTSAAGVVGEKVAPVTDLNRGDDKEEVGDEVEEEAVLQVGGGFAALSMDEDA